MLNLLDHYKSLWNLSAEGEPFETPSGLLQAVTYADAPCMLKIARRDKDTRSNHVMTWWNGDGAALVLKYDERTILMERATGRNSLTGMARNGRDDEASRIICDAVARLHAHAPPYPPGLVPLDIRFRSLTLAAQQQGGIFALCHKVAQQLLVEPKDIAALHGDIHHANILDFGQKGWLAIDPKGLLGEKGFDYANIFCNPDIATATAPGRLERQVQVISEAAGLEPVRLLQWIAAWAGLSAAWAIEDRTNPEPAMTVAGIALNKLNEIN
ncbi:MAG TPA: aminoglycoside phosphotransferase family protein [Mucilaginibacter sp.]|nr:aminoglycoside phosphotransferase family protein [Mucilaginibacter sp.]